ncbi:MAG: DNA repair protein RecN [Alphaproteobacteria bacterium]|nr:MAG: DNA repair protein RecN [Alphaproteobacteria bacterium]
MLVALSIRDIVLIDELDLELTAGLNVLTGETGAGKSILLDALGLATGRRADKSLVRHGQERGTASAAFEVRADHPALDILKAHGIHSEETGGRYDIILRRVQSLDGRTRAFVNDEPVGVNLLRSLGAALVEVHGQHDERGLLNAASHRALLDAFGRLGGLADKVALCYREFSEAQEHLEAARSGIAEARAQVDYLTHVLAELRDLNPQEDEEEALAARRTLMMHSEQIASELSRTLEDLTGSKGVLSTLPKSQRRLEKLREKAGDSLDPALAAIDRLLAEGDEARDELTRALREIEFNPAELEQSEERLFALRAAARKHNVRPGELNALMASFEERLRQAQAGEEELDKLEARVSETRAAYLSEAQTLSRSREKAALALDKAVAKELAPLKLEKATFKTHVTALPEDRAGEHGLDKVEFLISTNPGVPLGPMVAVASGGELARFILALKVCLAAQGSASTLIFDEVDQGVGGAVADAVGERLSRLAKEAQVLVVTHSPQVAARGDMHWRIQKSSAVKKGGATFTKVTGLSEAERREEIARMLSGAEITEEARAAADKLIGSRP